MTHIVHLQGVLRPTKAALRRLLDEDPRRVYFENPSLFGGWDGRADQMTPGQQVVCTDHPKRSWYARVARTEHGYKVG